ncbi:MAG: amidinotransferase [Bacteroidales bacterium]|nr:amidinotransferase [Bacteroidales bacterium]
MVRPAAFAFNEETSESNAFQQRLDGDVEQRAVEEFDSYASMLRSNGITVDVLQDSPKPSTPDSIFPNNCFSTHGDTLVLYPMCAPNRRLEREKLRAALEKYDFTRLVDLTAFESVNKFLEGTGSLVLDRENLIAYACISPRTDATLVEQWADTMGYTPVMFSASDFGGTAIYHTNVMMHIGSGYSVVCLDAVDDAAQRSMLSDTISKSGKETITISIEQMNQFAGNMLQLHNHKGEDLLVMSRSALMSLTRLQIEALEKYTRILAPEIPIIETVGGGSARCMIAEIFQD